MRIYVHTDHHTEGREATVDQAQQEVLTALSGLSERIARVDAYLTDQSGGSTGRVYKRCLLEVQRDGLHPSVVTHEASSTMEALCGALQKARSLLRSQQSRLDDRHSPASLRHRHDRRPS
jgi:hypothetical protein